MSMTVNITFDYELFFGANSGTAQKCMLAPTTQLIALAAQHKVQFTFFVDAGYLYQLQQHAHVPACAKIFQLLSEQLQTLHKHGHEIALHVHPHWQDSFFKDEQWHINTQRYKLADFSKEEVSQIFENYHGVLLQIIGKRCTAFRAGGWCVQPFAHISEALQEQRIFTDSSVYKNGYHQFKAHAYDFRNAPALEQWRFDKNECLPNEAGIFTELAITPHTLKPWFYWELYLKMKLNPAHYKPLGDGTWLKDKKKIYKQFYTSTHHFACCDGYFASQLIPIYKHLQRQQTSRMVVLGHPKSLANCSFSLLTAFINRVKQDGNTVTRLSPTYT